MIITTESGSTYDVFENEEKHCLMGQRIAKEQGYALSIDDGFKPLVLDTDRLMVGQRMVFQNGIVTTPIVSID